MMIHRVKTQSWLGRLVGMLRPSHQPFLYPGQELRPTRALRGRRDHHMAADPVAQRALDTGRTRMLVTAGLFALAFMTVGGRLVQVMVLGDAADGPPRAAAQAEEPGRRADIVDRNGLLLATNLPTVNLIADATKIGDPEDAANKLHAVLPWLKRDELLDKLSSGRKFVYLERNLTPRLQAAVNAAGVPGVDFETSDRRVYPHGRVVSHVLGATNPENQGLAGVELKFNQRLREDSTPLRLSIDLRVQSVVRDRLLEAMDTFKAKAAAGLVMDVHTGELLSMVSLPDYEPQEFGSAPDDARFNRTTLGVYEMGSTFKVFNTAMALDSGKIRVNDIYDTTHPLRIARFTISDDHPEPKPLNVAEILVHSSNIGSARMAVQLGAERQQAFLRKLGLLSAPTIEVAEVGAPMYPRTWGEINTMTISFGHGIAVTPVNLVMAMGAMVNGGLLRPTTLLAQDPGTEPSPGERVISPETSAVVRKLMRMVVTDGTAKKANVPGYEVGGKTGTAEKVSARGGYDTDALRNVFIAAFPMSAPRYVVMVVLDEPQPLKSTYGFATSGWNAAPTTGRVIASVAPLLGLFPQGPETIAPGGPPPGVQAAAMRGVGGGAYVTR